MMEDLIAEITPILVQLFITVLIAISGWLARSLDRYLKEKTWYNSVVNAVEWSVSCVEQLYVNGKLEGGVAKFNEAKKRALEILNTRKIPITEEALDTLIESIVAQWYPKRD